MQLYAVAYGRPRPELAVEVDSAVLRAATAFPALDPRTLERGEAGTGRLAFAALSHPPEVAVPRRYSARRAQTTVLFDGLPVERRGRFAAHDAAVLLERWDELVHSLEGVFSAVRIDLAAETVDCLVDVGGMAKVFIVRRASGWLVSNSVEALRLMAGLSEPDPLGVSALLTMGWPADRSLVRGVDSLAAGHLHRLSGARHSEVPYLTPWMVAPRRNPKEHSSAHELAEAMRSTMASATEHVRPLRCPITAGRDTRVLLALLLSVGAEADYYTSGEPGEIDVEVARDLASRLELPYRVTSPDTPGDPAIWRQITGRFVSQTDGLATLFGIADHLDHAPPGERLGLVVWGPGGEVARAGNIGLLIPFAANGPVLRSSLSAQLAVLASKTSSAGGLVRPEATATTRAYLYAFARERQAEGWRPREVLEAYYAFERVRNWAATGVRRMSGATDLYSPFVSRDFIRFAFSLTPGERYIEAAHYGLLTALSPQIRDMPFEKEWKPQRPERASWMACAAIARAGARRAAAHLGTHRLAPAAGSSPAVMPFGARWFEAGRESHAEVCLSFPQSPLWEFIDRSRLESMLAATPDEALTHVEGLCAVVTAFWYFHARHEATGAT